jgi:hypothetical protein
MKKLSKALGKAAKAATVTKKPLWRGPLEDGITQSLLSRFIVCRERFRIMVIDGLRPPDEFSQRMEYGSMWHIFEEYHGQGQAWEGPLDDYCRLLGRRYPLQQKQIFHWGRVCSLQFRVYVDFWAKHPDQLKKTNLMSEVSFRVPYGLPSGRTVTLRGKWDAVDLIGPKKDQGIYLQENKTKGEIEEQQLKRQLDFDLQTMLYLVALETHLREKGPLPGADGVPLRGVRYNVIRRPLAGGRHSITQHKGRQTNKGIVGAESTNEFYDRLQGLIAGEPEYFFMRWKSEVSKGDIERFKVQFLNPILEQLCDWWEIMESVDSDVDRIYMDAGDGYAVHWRTPYGVYNVLAEGGATEVDEYLRSGSTVGLQRANTLFPELE